MKHDQLAGDWLERIAASAQDPAGYDPDFTSDTWRSCGGRQDLLRVERAGVQENHKQRNEGLVPWAWGLGLCAQRLNLPKSSGRRFDR